MKIISIIGNGNMAFAIAQGLADTVHIEVIGRDIQKLENFQKKLGKKISILEYADGFSIENKHIILAVKPNNLDSVSTLLKGKAKNIFSILAGTKIESIKAKIQADSYIRAMPNLSALFQKSMTSISGDADSKELAINIFSTIGSTLWLESEDEIDIATAIAGSGPAYLSLVAEAIADGGVKAGLKRADAEKLIVGLFSGFSPLLESYKPSYIKDSVMSPKGTTAYGYATLENGAVRNSFIQAVESAYKRAIELGKS